MKYLIIIIAILTSCSPDWHLRRAKFKQPNILQRFNDTIRLSNFRYDTIYYNDTFEVVKTIYERDTIIETKYLAPKPRYKTRWKYKTIRDTVRIKERTKRTKARQENRTERTKSRRLWWLWLIIGSAAGFFVNRWFRSIF